jgi:FtsH-binding integral membrane protein
MLRRFVHEQSIGKLWGLALLATGILCRLTAVAPATFNSTVGWAIMIPVTILLFVAYYSPAPESQQ